MNKRAVKELVHRHSFILQQQLPVVPAMGGTIFSTSSHPSPAPQHAGFLSCRAGLPLLLFPSLLSNFFKCKFWGIILDLQKGYRDSTQNICMSCALPLNISVMVAVKGREGFSAGGWMAGQPRQERRGKGRRYELLKGKPSIRTEASRMCRILTQVLNVNE